MFLIASAERHSDSRHILTSSGGMGLVDDNGKPLFLQASNAVHDIRELLDGGRRFGIHELQLHVGHFDVVFQHIQQTAAGFDNLGIDEADDSISSSPEEPV